jgi:PAS domain S-box-containing protein
MFGTAQDITERQVAEDKVHQLNAELEQRVEARTAALKDSEERFRQLAENTKDVFWMSSVSGDRILYISPRYEEVWGRSCRNLYDNAHDWIDAIEPEDRPSVTTSWLALRTTGEYDAEYRIRRPDGTIRWIRDRALPVRDARGEIYRIAGIAEDFTERRAVERQVLEAKEAAETANRAKSDFLANMSHEIRTPLNGVIGITDLLLNSALDAQQQRFARLIKTSGQTLADLLNDILDFSKIEARKLELESIDFDLHAALEDVTEVMAHRAAEKGLELASCVGPDVPKLLRGDPARVKQILVNLVNNAIKFTTAGSVSTRLTLDSQSPEHVTARFAVADTGIGIGPDGLDRLFKSFSQVEASTTRTHGGTGLGLAIAKQLAELMGGAIGVESMPGQGSTFWFTVKLGVVPGQQPRPAAGIDLRGLRVLAVDGNATMREILREQIGNWGLDVATAADGAEGLEMLTTAASEGHPYRIAILESEMKTIDGLALAQVIKSRPDVSETGLLILLPMDTRVEPTALRAAGFCGHLLKPVRQSHLHDAIMNAIAAPGSRTAVDATPPILIAAHGSTGEAPVAARQARILLAEDNSVNQVVASEILARHGYTYEIVADGKKAVEAAALRTYDVILMDCSMPEMDGFEATAQIRRNEASDPNRAGCRVPIVALTANAIKGDRELCIAAGMDAYVSKPVDARRLIETIESLLAVREQPDGSVVHAPVQELEIPATQLPSAAPFAIDELLDRCMGSTSTALTIIDEFEKQVAHDLPELASNLAGGDGARAAKVAHALKGAAGVLSATAVHHSAAELERLCRAGNLANVDALLSQLREQVRECIEFIPGARTTISAVPQTPQVQGT